MDAQVRNIDEAADRLGVSVVTLYSWFGRDITSLNIYKLSEKVMLKYKERLASLQNSIEAARHATSIKEQAELDTIKGRIFEDTVAFLLAQFPPYTILRNKRTSTNEIDIILKKRIEYASFSDEIFPQRVICECKNYSQPVSVTYVGKLISLMRVSHCSIGIVFSIEGLSSRSKWTDSTGLCRKIALKDNVHVIEFKYEDLERVCDTSFIKIINDKVEELKSDIKIELSDHELCLDDDFINAQ